MLKQSYYKSRISKFINTGNDQLLGELTSNHHFALDIAQKNSWIKQIDSLKSQLTDFESGELFFEFSIPRMGKRVDALLLIGGIIFVVEYKIGAKHHDRVSIDQTIDYALDLKNFHGGSHSRFTVPILVSTKAAERQNVVEWYQDGVCKTLFSNGRDLAEVIKLVLSKLPAQEMFESDKWERSGYRPTPTIVEAAQALYQGHTVEEISRSDAGAKNLTHTANCISDIIRTSKINNRKSICFVTGVPGAGKTLAGLNISTSKQIRNQDDHAVFLSGNGPLVVVLREALARDEVIRAKAQGKKISKKEAASKVSSFIQNIHHFRDEGLKSEAEPVEHVVVFDEAQRAWNQREAEKFMVQKRGYSEFNMSEPEFLISVMDRKNDWCTIICLIGGGQEINKGEAGLIEWFDALNNRFTHWDVYYSDQIFHKNYTWNQDLATKLKTLRSTEKDDLHLSVSVRSYRAEKLSAFVGELIEGKSDSAASILGAIHKDYPIALTRDVNVAREWLREHARGTERYGLVASSGSIRLKPEGINVKSAIDPTTWFLNDKNDIRSSYYLEDVATEFDIQGLELDWVGVCWDADFRFEGGGWSLYQFKGTKWQNVKDAYRRVYLANAYRVLLTRARQGLVICVPHGDDRDYTRPSSFYDGTYEFLRSCGIAPL